MAASRPARNCPPPESPRLSLAFSRNTAAEVYERLVTEGHAVTRHGAGTYVAERASGSAAARRIVEISGVQQLNEFWLRADVNRGDGFLARLARIVSGAQRLGRFSTAMVDSRSFRWMCFAASVPSNCADWNGIPPATKARREIKVTTTFAKAIIKHIAITRAVACRRKTYCHLGAQQAFDLLARALVTPHETTVALEDPGYPPMRVALPPPARNSLRWESMRKV